MLHALAVTGPTASGKTALSIHLAKLVGAEIISCDSMQIYKHMDIGTAKATAEERQAVPHHMIDVIMPCENYSAQDYREDALKAAREICARGKVPMFVGGTGLYIDTVMRPVLESPASDSTLRESMLASVRDDSDVQALWDRLNSVDPESAAKIHKNNVKRVVRALEIYELTGKPKSYFDTLSLSGSKDIDVKMITLDFHDRDNLYKRVDMRVDLMIKEGLVEEARFLYGSGLLKEGSTAASAIGYKELKSYLDGLTSLEESVELIKLSSRRYAKRQLTWFRHEADALRVYVDTESGKMKSMEEIISEAQALIGI